MTTMVIVAHPDDEAFGLAGTIARIAKSGERVIVVSLCKGNRPGAEYVESSRVRSFQASCEHLGAEWKLFSNSDVGLDEREAAAIIENMVKTYCPTTVYTHNINDLHRDHVIVANATIVACRPTPTSTVDKLLMFEIPGTSEWLFGSTGTTFVPSVYVDVGDYMEIKQHVLSLYNTELRSFPDARSIESVCVLARHRGKQVGVDYAEAFQLVFSRDRTSP